jgi:hypothetical protein
MNDPRGKRDDHTDGIAKALAGFGRCRARDVSGSLNRSSEVRAVDVGDADTRASPIAVGSGDAHH